MKFFPAVAILALVASVVHANDDTSTSTPVYKVVNLLRSLQKEIHIDGKAEQMVFDKYSCWVESVTKELTADNAKATEEIAQAGELIIKLAADIATGQASIKNLADDISENSAAQKEAAEKRQSEHEAYMATAKDNVAARNALITAIKVLNATGTGAFLEKGKFLGALQQAEVLSVVGGVRKALKHFETSTAFSDDDLNLVRDFAHKPADFLNKQGMSAAQVSEKHNPFGDYSPQSTRIQGILKGMLESMVADLKSNYAEEQAAVKEYNALLTTRKKELETFTTTKTTEEKTLSSNKKLLSETRETKQEDEHTVDDNEAFLEDTKEAAQAKARAWAERSRLRAEELLGINEAIQILTTDKAQDTFVRAFTTFVETSSVQVKAKPTQSRARLAYTQLQALATRYRSTQIAKLAAGVQEGGHFDNVIAKIDEMMELLRKEEAADLFHKDRCESGQNANKNELQDLSADLGKVSGEIEQIETTMGEITTKIQAHEGEVKAAEGDMAAQLDLRNKGTTRISQALKDDVEAIGLIEQAIASLTKYYTKNKLTLGGLLQHGSNPTTYSVDRFEAPEADFSSGEKLSSQSGGIVAILEMIKEDLEKEVNKAREQNAKEEAEFEDSKSKLQASIDSLEAGIATLESQYADASSDLAAATDLKTRKKSDQDGQEALEASLQNDCDWVKSHFDSRYAKRKTEMQGLTDAKAYLSGIA